MSGKQETIGDIVADMRGYSHGMPDAYHVTMTWHDFRRVIDRIEAASQRVASKMHALQRDLWQGKKMGAFAFALALDGFESALSATTASAKGDAQ